MTTDILCNVQFAQVRSCVEIIYEIKINLCRAHTHMYVRCSALAHDTGTKSATLAYSICLEAFFTSNTLLVAANILYSLKFYKIHNRERASRCYEFNEYVFTCRIA